MYFFIYDLLNETFSRVECVGRVTTNELKQLWKNPFVKETNLIHFLSSVYFVNQPLHV